MKGYRVSVDQLRVGVYIHLERSWLEHPFLRSSFKIKDQKQIEVIRKAGVPSVIWVPEKSDAAPYPEAKPNEAAEPDQPEPIEEQGPDEQTETEEIPGPRETKEEDLAREAVFDGSRRGAKGFGQTVERTMEALTKLESSPAEMFEEAGHLIQGMVQLLHANENAPFYLMDAKEEKKDLYYHSVNVMVMSLMLGKAAGLNQISLQELGIGSLLHDVGKWLVPAEILSKTEPLTSEERKIFELHPVYGHQEASRIEGFPPDAVTIVRHHHETLTGGGYPDRLVGAQMDLLARIVAIVDTYDNLCNAPNPVNSLSPHQALGYMFGQHKQRFDEDLLALFVRSLGVYPPGSIVELSDERLGMVLQGNPKASLQPILLLHDPSVSKNLAPVIDLREHPGLKVVKTLRPGDLSDEVYEYLSPRKRITYFLDIQGQGASEEGASEHARPAA